MQDIVFLTPGGVREDSPLGHRHVTTTLAVDLSQKSDLYLTFPGKVEGFRDLHDTLHPGESGEGEWINEATNYGGLKRSRELRYDDETQSMWLRLYERPSYANPREFRGLTIRRISQQGLWPYDTAEWAVISPLDDTEIGVPFSVVTLKNVPSGKSIIRYCLRISNREEQVAEGTTVFSLMGASELKAELEGALNLLSSFASLVASADERERLEEAHEACAEIYQERTKYGPSDYGVYDAIVKAYPGCTSQQLLDTPPSQRVLESVRLPWANPANGDDRGFMGTLHTSTGGSFKLRLHVEVPQSCENWQWPSDPACTAEGVADPNPKPRFAT